MPYRCAGCGRFLSDAEEKVACPVPDYTHSFVDDWEYLHPSCDRGEGPPATLDKALESAVGW